MSEAKVLNSGAVTTLADNDLVVACDAGGTMRPISVSNLLALVRGSLQVGGRNLLKNSGITKQTSSYGMGTYDLTEDFEANEVAMVTIWGELGLDRGQFSVFNGTGNGNDGNVNLSKVGDGVYRAYLKFLVPSASRGSLISVYQRPQNGTTISTINRIKLERGNVATDWTPAPEDLGWGGVNATFSITYDCSAAAAQKVSSVGTADRVLLMGSNGDLKKIESSFGKSANALVPAGNWVRIGRTKEVNISATVLFSIVQGWANAKPQSALIAACFSAIDYQATLTSGNISVLASSVTRNAFTKARFVVPSQSVNQKAGYLDVFQAADNPHNYITVFGSSNFIFELSTSANIPEGYTTKEFNLTVGGGKTLCISRLCFDRASGGRRAA